MSNLQTCWRQTVCQNRLRTASPQGIAALAAQGGVATLSERSERRPRIADFISGRGKLRRTHDTWSLDYV